MNKRLCSIRDQALAEMIEDILLQEGLHPVPLGAAGHVSLAGGDNSYDLWVPEEEEENARELLAATGYQDALVRK